MRALLLMLIGCGHEVTPPDAAPRQLDIDVTVGHDGVTVFANGTDVIGGGCAPNKFPQVGETTEWEDVGCQTTCLTAAAVVSAGAKTTARHTTDPIWFQVDVTATPDAVLELVGCGGMASVPIGGLGAPRPTAAGTFDPTTNTISVSWTTDTRASTAVVDFWGNWGEVIHVAATRYSFTPPPTQSFVPYWLVSVRTFGAMSFLETPFGIVKIWPGDAAGAPITTPSTPN
jgi:hypothetical protein